MASLLCATCDRWKEPTEFYSDPRSATKRKKDCKVCYNQKRAHNPTTKEYDRKRKAEKYADPKWRKAFNEKRKKRREVSKLVRAACAKLDPSRRQVRTTDGQEFPRL